MNTTSNKLILSALAILMLSSRFAGQQAEKGLPPQEKHEVEVRLILVDVIATKEGEFFPGLKKADFKLYEDGKEVEINSCDLISLGKSDFKLTEEKEPITPDIARKKRLAVIFDGINAWDREFKKAAQQIADELVSLAKSGLEVMVLFLDNQKGLKITQPFTDQEALIRAAAAKSSGGAFSPYLEYLDYDDVLFAARTASEDLKSIGAGGFALGPIYEMRALEHANSAADKFRRTIGGLLASLCMLESLPGRKNILFVSSGFPDIDTFNRDNMLTNKGRVDIFDPFGILGGKTFQTGEAVLKEIIRVANDRNISIYSFDPSTFSKNIFAGASAEYFDRETAASQKTLIDEKYRQMQNLKILSEKTGAALLRGANKLESFRQIVRNDLSYYYQLSYYPPKKKKDQAYHKIEVRVKGRDDIRIRFREGYSELFAEQSQRLALAKAFNNPELFRDNLPFRAEFIPFSLDSGKYQPWMSLALPAREFFIDRFAGFGKKAYEFHFWIKGEEGSDRVLAGSIAIPFDIDASFKDRLSSLDFLRLFFVGPGIELADKEYRVVFALFHPETGEIGTWSSNFPRPYSKGSQEAAFINCILGNAAPNQNKAGESFSLNGKDGTLECGQIKFFPEIAGRFSNKENVYIFFQVYFPQGGPIEAKFDLTDKNALSQRIEGAKVAESWNKNSKVWSGVFQLDCQNDAPGDYVLRIEVLPPAGKPSLLKEVKLTLF